MTESVMSFWQPHCKIIAWGLYADVKAQRTGQILSENEIWS